MIKLADDMMGRGGRMVDAVNAIGQGRYSYPGAPFELTIRRQGNGARSGALLR
jgi:hypothetical protein